MNIWSFLVNLLFTVAAFVLLFTLPEAASNVRAALLGAAVAFGVRNIFTDVRTWWAYRSAAKQAAA